jgi:hypothetical protein
MILQEKQTHIENLEKQREVNYRDWQAQMKALNEVIQLLEHPKGFRGKMGRIREILFPKEP